MRACSARLPLGVISETRDQFCQRNSRARTQKKGAADLGEIASRLPLANLFARPSRGRAFLPASTPYQSNFLRPSAQEVSCSGISRILPEIPRRNSTGRLKHVVCDR